MSLITDIESHLDQILGTIVREAGDERVYTCPYCSKDNLWINTKKMLVHCFTCPYGMGLAKFLAQYHNLPPREIGRMLAKALPARFGIDSPVAEEPPDVNVSISIGMWMDRFRDPLNPKGDLGRRARDYLLKPVVEGGRGLSMEKVVRHHIRYAWQRKDRYYGRIMVPVLEYGDVVYFVARDFIGRDKKYKYLNPNPNEIQKTAGQVLFNFDRARNHDTVIVVEGVFDAISVGLAAVAMLGKTLSPGQIRVLLEAGIRNLLMICDRDVTMREKEEQNKKLRANFKSVRWAPTPKLKDPGDMTKQEINQLIARAEPLHIGALGSQTFRPTTFVKGTSRWRR